MNQKNLVEQWLAEEQAAHIHGWDFSHIHDRYEEGGDLPWDYRQTVLDHLSPTSRLLDLDTGGAEFLLSLGHPHHLTAATEAYPPNVSLCRELLTPLGVDFREADAAGPLPFEDASFDLVINRHGGYNPGEIARVLKPGGVFITQQVGADNDRDLVSLLLPALSDRPFPDQRLEIAAQRFEQCGLTLLEGQTAYRAIRFRDVGALVWFARIIEWEFPGFSVEGCLDRLLAAQALLDEKGVIEGTTHRFLLVAQKP